MLLTRSCQHAIVAMTYLAKQDRGHLISIREISERVDVSSPFLAKILGALSRQGLIRTRRGPKGGVTISRPPARITVEDIVEAIDGPLDQGLCALGFAACSENNPCPMHDTSKRLHALLLRTLRGSTLQDLAQAPTKGGRKARE